MKVRVCMMPSPFKLPSRSSGQWNISPGNIFLGNTSLATLFRCSLFCLLAFTAAEVRADLKPNQARKSITRMPGFELTNGAVRVKSVTMSGAATAEAAAEIRTVFKLQKDPQGNWRVAEIRTRPSVWEEIDFIARALNAPNLSTVSSPCIAPDPPFKGSSAIQPTMKRARCLVGNLLSVEVPSDAVRIQEVSPLEIPLADQPSAVVVAWVRVDVRLLSGPKGWQVTELRTGQNNWANLDLIIAAVNEMKRAQARIELVAIAKALETFRVERGSYVVSDSHAVLIDYLNPRYLPVVVRLDPWSQPYQYQGSSGHFTLRSLGADGKENTPDDIVLGV
ncbi:MAG: type II secretion system protein GspG [Pyrinomonadaceae bacterium]|nr:type II secretion system protein GspG [Pyrinomonadaceae bacterium]